MNFKKAYELNGKPEVYGPLASCADAVVRWMLVRGFLGARGRFVIVTASCGSVALGNAAGRRSAAAGSYVLGA